MPPLLIHIGYHKTATTWMQMRLFHPEHGYTQLADHKDLFEGIVKPHNLAFDPAPFRDTITARMAEAAPDLVPTLSSEILSGQPFYGGRESDLYATRLHQAFPEAQILISIRAQLRILPSVYMQYLYRGGRKGPEAYFDGEAETGFFGFDPIHFEYDRLVAHYQGLFGADRVYVMTQESLVQDMQASAHQLAGFAQAGRYDGLSDAALRVQSASYPEAAAPALRRSNHLRRSVLNPVPPLPGNLGNYLYRGTGWLWRRGPLKGLGKSKRPLSALVKDRFADRFTDSNQRLAKIITHPIDLSAYR